MSQEKVDLHKQQKHDRKKLVKKRKIEQVSLVIAGAALVGFGLRENLVLICASGFGFFAMLPFANNSLDYLVRTNIAEELQIHAFFKAARWIFYRHSTLQALPWSVFFYIIGLTERMKKLKQCYGM